MWCVARVGALASSCRGLAPNGQINGRSLCTYLIQWPHRRCPCLGEGVRRGRHCSDRVLCTTVAYGDFASFQLWRWVRSGRWSAVRAELLHQVGAWRWCGRFARYFVAGVASNIFSSKLDSALHLVRSVRVEPATAHD